MGLEKAVCVNRPLLEKEGQKLVNQFWGGAATLKFFHNLLYVGSIVYVSRWLCIPELMRCIQLAWMFTLLFLEVAMFDSNSPQARGNFRVVAGSIMVFVGALFGPGVLVFEPLCALAKGSNVPTMIVMLPGCAVFFWGWMLIEDNSEVLLSLSWRKVKYWFSLASFLTTITLAVLYAASYECPVWDHIFTGELAVLLFCVVIGGAGLSELKANGYPIEGWVGSHHVQQNRMRGAGA